ncbi:MAG: alpha/beta hydrolase [Sulfitobacter sp.]
MSLVNLTVNPQTGRAQLHQTAIRAETALLRSLRQSPRSIAPIVIMIHGYKYEPSRAHNCPHASIFSPDQPHSWPDGLGITPGGATLGIGFGWGARGKLRRAFVAARSSGRELARLIRLLHRAAPQRPVHLLAHSMGAEVALSALAAAPAGSVKQVIVMAAASYQSAAFAALNSPAGRSARLINATTAQNALFNRLFETLIAPPKPGDRALGRGIAAPNAVTLRLDCARAREILHQLGAPLAASRRPICHWSVYTAPGALRLYRRMIHAPGSLDWHLLRSAAQPRSFPAKLLAVFNRRLLAFRPFASHRPQIICPER